MTTKVMKMIGTAAAVVALIGAISGGVYLVEDRYALRAEVTEVTQYAQSIHERLELKIQEDRHDYWSRELNKLKNAYGPDCGNRKDQCEMVKQQLEKAKREMERQGRKVPR